MKRTVTDWLKVLALLLDDGAAVVLVILILRFLGIQIPLPLMIVMGLLVGTLIFVIHIAVIPTFRRRPVTGSEAMIGAQGRVVEPLNPVGAVNVNGEYWKAKSVEGGIEANEIVEVVGLEGLTLKVKRKANS
jgi:membrane-bound serine protease (ClpP class)